MGEAVRMANALNFQREAKCKLAREGRRKVRFRKFNRRHIRRAITAGTSLPLCEAIAHAASYAG